MATGLYSTAPMTFSHLPGSPRIIRREDHTISRRNIDSDALKVMYRLNRHGYLAFMVGGGVRDLLLGKSPKDFDIGTDARTETVRGLFRNSRTIGRRFRLNQVFFHGGKIFEVSTFRQEGQAEEEEPVGPRSDNEYGDPETDALRRDLTINGLFYDAETYSVIDYVGGMQDLEDGIIRIIGEPEVRIKEDPVRMIRATRHAARTGFTIEPKTYQAICKNVGLIMESSPARVREEFLREFRGGSSRASFMLLRETGLLDYLAPPLAELYRQFGDPMWNELEKTLDQIDTRVRAGEELSQALLFAALFFDRIPVLAFPLGEGAEVRELWTFKSEFKDEDLLGRLIATGAVRAFIGDFFRALGVSRKEGEVLEQMIIGRYALIQAYLRTTARREQTGQDFPPPRLNERSYYRHALELMEFLKSDELTAKALEFWREQGGAARPPRHDRQRRRRRRRPRGRGEQSPGEAV